MASNGIMGYARLLRFAETGSSTQLAFRSQNLEIKVFHFSGNLPQMPELFFLNHKSFALRVTREFWRIHALNCSYSI